LHDILHSVTCPSLVKVGASPNVGNDDPHVSATLHPADVTAAHTTAYACIVSRPRPAQLL